MSSLTSVFTQESLSLPNTPRSSFKESVRNSLRKLKRGRKSKQERREEERMRKKGRRGDFEVEVALTEVEEKEEVKGTVVRAHSSRRRGRERSTRCSLLEEIGKEGMVRVAEEGNGDSSFTIFPEMEKQKSNLLPRFVPLANSNIFLFRIWRREPIFTGTFSTTEVWDLHSTLQSIVGFSLLSNKFQSSQLHKFHS